jgi:hypothetical protein
MSAQIPRKPGKRTRSRSLPLRSEPDPKIHVEPLSDAMDDMIADLHPVLAPLRVLERGTGLLPTHTFVDGTFTSSELHALALAARDQLRTILGHRVMTTPDARCTLHDMLWAARELLSKTECYGSTTDDGQCAVAVVKIIDLVRSNGQELLDELDIVEGAEAQAACEAAGIEWAVQPAPVA